MYAKDLGLSYDPNSDKLLTPQEASKISGLSFEQYKAAAGRK